MHKCLALLYPYSNRCTPYCLALFPGAYKKLERSTWYPLLRMHGSPGELGNHCVTSPCYTQYITDSQELLHLQDTCCIPSVRSEFKARNGAEGWTTDGNTACLKWYGLVCMANIYRKLLYMVLPFVFVPHIHFEKATAAYCHHRLGHRTTVVHGVAAHCSVYFTEYFSTLLFTISA